MHVAILGATGYSGNVLFNLLAQHPNVDAIKLYGHEGGKASRFLDDEVPAFFSAHLPILPFNPEEIMANNDLLFCATPAGVTKDLMEPFILADFPVIDLSGDFRLTDPAVYEKWYHKKAAPAGLLEKATYGLAEFPEENPGKYIANPGCYATATLLGLAPLVIEHMIQTNAIIVDAKSGVSGSGKKLSPSSQYNFINENVWLYKMNKHQHIPEIMQKLNEWDSHIPAIQFSTTLIPVTRGIMATIYLKPLKEYTNEQLLECFHQFYDDAPFVRFRDNDLPTIKEVAGSNFCDIGINYNPVTNTITLVSVIDNLMKGAAGQAIQNFNLLWNLEPTSGLPTLPIFP